MTPSIYFNDDLRLGDGEFVIFAAHRFDEDGEMQFSASADAGGIIAEVLFDFERDVRLSFLGKAVADFIHRDVFAVFAHKGAVIDHDFDGEGRLGDGRWEGAGRCESDRKGYLRW